MFVCVCVCACVGVSYVLHSQSSSELTFCRFVSEMYASELEYWSLKKQLGNMTDTATHCKALKTLQHAAMHCNALQHAAMHCNALQHTATHCDTLQHTATHCNILQYTATHQRCIPLR